MPFDAFSLPGSLKTFTFTEKLTIEVLLLKQAIMLAGVVCVGLPKSF